MINYERASLWSRKAERFGRGHNSRTTCTDREIIFTPSCRLSFGIKTFGRVNRLSTECPELTGFRIDNGIKYQCRPVPEESLCTYHTYPRIIIVILFTLNSFECRRVRPYPETLLYYCHRIKRIHIFSAQCVSGESRLGAQ